MEQLLVSDGTDTATLTKKNVGETETQINTWLLEINVAESSRERSQRMLEAAAQTVSISGGGNIEYWVENANDELDSVPISAGYVPFRDLKILSRALPAIPSQIRTREFTSADVNEVIRINNSAFDWHPEQRDMTEDRLSSTQSEAWHIDDGFRILEDNQIVKGFCWMKLHGEHCSCCKKSKQLRGEIFVIAVDPVFQGDGVGRELALSGLEWLSTQKIREVFLYVESDNFPALKIYDSIGFQHSSTNRCFQRIIRKDVSSKE
ncbi:MAG: GNAT family N-acetyltransferase [Actinomycetota bacterium]|nr:GNAT family N-acetyltransferase [Actinomycetota bacterium]